LLKICTQTRFFYTRALAETLTARTFINSSFSVTLHIIQAEAVECARQTAVSGDIVLLSPACASYDMFDNFQHRRREFSKLVGGIID